MNKKIGIFDSGIGGLTTYEEIKRLLPNEDYIFYADKKNHPYGEKTLEELCIIADEVVSNLLKKDVKLIVIACNTATTNCIDFLRSKYKDIEFVGTEPAIKVACDNNYKNILVMATSGTINSERTHTLLSSNKKEDEKFYLLECEGLANAIESKDENRINELLKTYLTEYQSKNIDAVVLACTHYPIIKNKIQAYFPNAALIDGNIGVAKRVKYILEKKEMLNPSTTEGSFEIIRTE